MGLLETFRPYLQPSDAWRDSEPEKLCSKVLRVWLSLERILLTVPYY